MTDHTTAWVCVDCYFAHHYGASERDGKWFAGDTDTPTDREPLALFGVSYDIADNTDSETGEGIDEFSSRSCEGCGSTLGGARYRLALFAQKPKPDYGRSRRILGLSATWAQVYQHAHDHSKEQA